MGRYAYALVFVCFVIATIDLLKRRDWSGALMTFGSVIFTAGAIWKLYQ